MASSSLRDDLVSACSRWPNSTLSRIDNGRGLGRWNTMPTRRRTWMREAFSA